MTEVQMGVFGTGFIGPAHVEAVRRLGYVKVVALAEQNDELAQQKAEALSIPQSTGNYTDILEDDSIQVIHVCAPNYLHYEMVKKALEAGKHVVCEKPLAMNSEQSGELVQLAARRGLQNAVNFNYRFYALVQEARERIRQGDIGRVRLVHGSYLQDWLLFDTDWNWRLDPELGGESRAVADIGSHWCDLMTHIIGRRITDVFAKLDTVVPIRKRPKGRVETFAGSSEGEFEEVQINTEDTGTVLFKMEGGIIGNFMVSQVSPGRKNRLYFEIDGENKSLVWDQEEPESIWMGHRDEPNEVLVRDGSLVSEHASQYTYFPAGHPEGYPELLKNCFELFYRPIATGKTIGPDQKAPYADFAAGDYEVRLVESILESNRKQEWVNVK